MRLDHPDYTRLVTAVYKEKRADGSLSTLLVNSTPANIRKECLNVYHERHDKKDDQVLRDFFGPAENDKKRLHSIQIFETGKFKPLDNYLKEKTEKTDHANLELLAWLVNFRHRPYKFGMDVILEENELALFGDLLVREDIKDDPVLGPCMPEEEPPGADGPAETAGPVFKPETSTRKAPRNILKPVLISLSVAIASLGMYALVPNMNIFQSAFGSSGCMVWLEDHYEEVPCMEEHKGRLILPLDEKKIKNLRKITRKDTITEQSIGRIFYIKDSNIIKYYTDGGKYPEDLNRSLKKLSRGIFEKDSSNRKLHD